MEIIKKIIGGCLLALPFIGIFLLVALEFEDGLKVALIGFGISILVIALIMLGVWLIFS